MQSHAISGVGVHSQHRRGGPGSAWQRDHADLAAACILAAIIYGYHLYILLSEAIESGEIDIRTFEIPMWLLFVSMPLCFFMCAMEFGRFLLGIDDMYDQNLIERDSV